MKALSREALSRKTLLGKPLPRRVGWLHTLGSLLIVYLAFQALSGILLGLYYSAAPEAAYDSMRYIREELWLGLFLHRLHRYGAGFVMITALLHFGRSYFLGAYRKPRQWLWVTGLGLGVLLTLFAFTGQLLPWDQRGYWATIVGVEIAASAPGAGEHVRAALTGGYGDLGSVTLSRFFLLHVCLLPLGFAALLGLHLWILQKVGPAGGEPDPANRFYPQQMFRDTVVSASGALLLVIVAALLPMTETGPADPSPGGYVPRPEWYFLAHYQLLKWVPPLLGAFVLPNLLFAALLLLPWIDRNRRVVVGLGATACVALVLLTGIGLAQLPDEPAGQAADKATHGPELLHAHECIQCHSLRGEGGTTGPPLDATGTRLKSDYIEAWLRNPRRFRPTTEMPAFSGSEEELQAVIEFLLSLEES